MPHSRIAVAMVRLVICSASATVFPGCGGGDGREDVVDAASEVAPATPDAATPDAATPDAATPDANPSQMPPTTSAELDAWTLGKPWESWTCEPGPRAPRLNSPHDLVRVCLNDLLVNAPPSGDLPVGSAAVKEMYFEGSVYAYTIAIRGRPGPGVDRWFWWRKVIDGSENPPVSHQGYDETFCSGCHAGAATNGGRDAIFTLLPPP